MKAAAQAGYLSRPYPHAKLIIADCRGISDSISVGNLEKNREVGLVVEGSLLAWRCSGLTEAFGAAWQ